MKKTCEVKATRKSEKMDVFAGRPLRTEMLKNLAKSYKSSLALSTPGGVCGGRAKAKTTEIPKFTIDRVAGVKKLSRKFYYKIHWFGWSSKYDSWEPVSQLHEDTSVQYMQKLLKEYNDAPHIAADVI